MNENPPQESSPESVPDDHQTPIPVSQSPPGETYRVKMSDEKLYGPITLGEVEQWAREGRIPKDALLFPSGGGDPKSVFAVPRLAAILSSTPTSPTAVATTPTTPTSKSFLFPTANKYALIGYYISVAGFLIPLLCPLSLILGVLGIIRAIKYPKAKGMAHGIVAIALSFGSPLFWYLIYDWMEIV